MPESQEERASARAQNMPRPYSPAHQLLVPPTRPCACASRPLGARPQGRVRGARVRERARRQRPRSGPSHRPRPRAEAAGVEGVAAPRGPGRRGLSAPSRARRPRASPLERTGESPLRRAGPARGCSGQVCSGAGDPRDPESYNSLSRSSSRPELPGAP